MPATNTASKAAETQRLVWSDAMSVGVPEVDEDHKALIDLIGMIESASEGEEADAVLGTVLAALMDYTEFHFEREERMQEAIGYSGLAEHHAHHETLKRQVMDYVARHAGDPASIDIRELARFLQSWLVQHILKEDWQYKPLAEKNQKAASEAIAKVGVDFFMDDKA